LVVPAAGYNTLSALVNFTRGAMVPTYAVDKHLSPPLLVSGGAVRDSDHREVAHYNV
jgi:hypothetical protein